MSSKRLSVIVSVVLLIFFIGCGSTADKNNEPESRNRAVAWVLDRSLKESPDIPERVRFSVMSEAEIEEFLTVFSEKLAHEEEYVSVFGDAVLIGPFLSNVFKKLELDKKYDFLPVQARTTIGGEQVVLNQFAVVKNRDPEGHQAIIESIRKMIMSDMPFKVRRPTYEEIDWYWTIISFDIEDPFFVIYNDNCSMLIDISKSKIFSIDDINNLQWKAQ